MTPTTDFSTLGRLGTTRGTASGRRPRPASATGRPRPSGGRPRPPARRRSPGRIIGARIGLLVAAVVVVLLTAVGLAVGGQTGTLPAVSVANLTLDPLLEASLRDGASQRIETGTLSLTPGGGADTGSVEAPPPFAAVDDVALHLPVANPQGVIFLEADSAAALPLVPVGTMTRNANPEGFSQPQPFDGPDFEVAPPASGVRPATGMAALLTAPGVVLRAPVQGIVTGVSEYTAEDGSTDVKVMLQPLGRPDLQVVIRRIDVALVVPGQQVTVGVTEIGTVRAGVIGGIEDNPLGLPAVLVHVRPATVEETTDPLPGTEPTP